MSALPPAFDPLKVSRSSNFCSVDSSILKAGTRLGFPIFDERHVLLLAGGQVINEAFLNRLSQRGINSIRIHRSELSQSGSHASQRPRDGATAAQAAVLCPLRNDATEHMDTIASGGPLQLPPQGDPFAACVQPHGAVDYEPGLLATFAERQQRGVGKVKALFQSMSDRRRLDLDVLTAVIDDALVDLEQDSDLFASLGINPRSNEYPASHSLCVATLALIIGTRMQLDRPTLKELATGCLIHDAGMLRIDRERYWNDRVLTNVEFREIAKHPVYTFDMITDVRSISACSSLIAFQTHERCNGSGYPRGRNASQIHPLSRIAAVADAYIGLVSPRPWRPAMLPYHAMKQTLCGVREGAFDSIVVRALLESLSLFPPGSIVQLSDGRVGRVIRQNRESYTAPVIEAWNAGEVQGAPVILNLSESQEQIVGVLTGLEAAA